MNGLAVLRNVGALCRARRRPSARAVAALAKLNGYRLERRWPFLIKSDPSQLNFGYDDVLEFQYARSKAFYVLVVGAYDGIANDPLSRFLAKREWRGILIEPQPDIFVRLRSNFEPRPGLHLLNAAVDEHTGSRELFQVRGDNRGLPQWTEQLASFSKEHIAKHEDRAPGLANHIVSTEVRTISFLDLIDEYKIQSIDVLQIDAEGVDALLLSWFPFDRVRPGVVHYEIAHMTEDELHSTRRRLQGHGYHLHPTESPLDEMAILI